MSLTLTLERGGGEVSGSGTNIELDGTIAGGAIESVEMYGDTEQQTYSGKNQLASLVHLVSSDNGITSTLQSDGSVKVSGTVGSSWNGFNLAYYNTDDKLAVGTYTLSIDHSIAIPFSVSYRDSSNNNVGGATIAVGSTSATFTLSTAADKGSIWCAANTGTAVDFTVKAMVESGSSATSFEPYVGGTASPNPDYPQEVQTVTGRQVVTISDGGSESQEYEINLGDIELCKIGTYKDVIFRNVPSSSYYSSALDEGDWYVKKNINQLVLNGSESWETTGTNVYALYVSGGIKRVAEGLLGVCNYYTFNPVQTSVTATLTAGQFAIQFINPNTQHRLFMKNTSISTTSDFQTWLGTHNTKVYYPLATPTDTQITNSALIAQLNALNAGDTYDGTTLITVSSENLAGSLDVTVSSNITKTYTEVEIGSPFTIADVEGKSSNTTLDGNVYVDWAYNKKQYSFDLFNLTPQDYADIRAFYDYQFNNSAFPTITVPELDINKLPVYMEISSRNIINQCLLTDKLTIKFRETVQP